MIQKIIWLFFIFILTIVGLSIYLQPNDIGKCGEKPSDLAGCQPVDAVVAISGGDTNARAIEAIALYKNGWANKIIFSGAAEDKSGPSNAAAMKVLALKADVPELSIWLDEYSENTKENALNAQTIFSKLNIKSVILVTSGYHQRRASLEFNKRAKDVTILNRPVQNDKDWSIWWWSTPIGWILAVSEFIKIIIFFFSGLF